MLPCFNDVIADGTLHKMGSSRWPQTGFWRIRTAPLSIWEVSCVIVIGVTRFVSRLHLILVIIAPKEIATSANNVCGMDIC